MPYHNQAHTNRSGLEPQTVRHSQLNNIIEEMDAIKATKAATKNMSVANKVKMRNTELAMGLGGNADKDLASGGGGAAGAGGSSIIGNGDYEAMHLRDRYHAAVAKVRVAEKMNDTAEVKEQRKIMVQLSRQIKEKDGEASSDDDGDGAAIDLGSFSDDDGARLGGGGGAEENEPRMGHLVVYDPRVGDQKDPGASGGGDSGGSGSLAAQSTERAAGGSGVKGTADDGIGHLVVYDPRVGDVDPDDQDEPPPLKGDSGGRAESKGGSTRKKIAKRRMSDDHELEEISKEMARESARARTASEAFEKRSEAFEKRMLDYHATTASGQGAIMAMLMQIQGRMPK